MVKSALLWFLNVVLGDTFVLMCVMFALIGTLEYFLPAHKITRGHYNLNLRFAFVNVFVIGIVAPLLAITTAYAIREVGLGLIDLHELGLGGFGGNLIALAVGTLIWDFLQYWQHRLLHGNKILWQAHLLHHSDEHMNVTTTSRQHIFEIMLAPFFITIPMAILFKMPSVTIAVLSLLPFAWLYISHANINLGFGPLWWLLVSPNYHRLHHSLMPEHIDKNFANWFPLWDIVFGTVRIPRRRECPSTGVRGVSVRLLREAYFLPLKGWISMYSRRMAGEIDVMREDRPSPNDVARRSRF